MHVGILMCMACIRSGGFVFSVIQDAQRGAGTDAEVEDAIDAELDAAARVEELPLPLHAGEEVAGVATRTFHSAALTSHGRLIVFGDNAYGQLGTEAANQTAVGESHMGVPLGPSHATYASAVALGEVHTYPPSPLPTTPCPFLPPLALTLPTIP